MQRSTLVLLSMAFACGVQAGEVQVAVVADFAWPLAKISEAFTAATRHTLKVSAEPTGKFYAQIVASAPVEVLIVADESIAQAYQFVLTGDAELGIAAPSQVVLPGKPVLGSYRQVPGKLYGEGRQDAVPLPAGGKNRAGAALLAFLQGDPARRVIQEDGDRL